MTISNSLQTLRQTLHQALQHRWIWSHADTIHQLFSADNFIADDGGSRAYPQVVLPLLDPDGNPRPAAIEFRAASRTHPLRLIRPSDLSITNEVRACNALIRALNPPLFGSVIARAQEDNLADQLSDALDSLSVMAALCDTSPDTNQESFVEFAVHLLCLAPAHQALAADLCNLGESAPQQLAITLIVERLKTAVEDLNRSLEFTRNGKSSRVDLTVHDDPRSSTIALRGPRGSFGVAGHPIWTDALCAEAGLGSLKAAMRRLSEGSLDAPSFLRALNGLPVHTEHEEPTPCPGINIRKKKAVEIPSTNQPKPPKTAQERPISNEILAVLSAGEIAQDQFRLSPAILDRTLYQKVRDELRVIGFRWNTAKQAFLPKHAQALKRLQNAVSVGRVLDAKDYDYFPTPENLARRLLQMSDIAPGMRVLEPSCGELALARLAAEVVGKSNVVCLDINPEFVELAKQEGFEAHLADFLHIDLDSLGRFDLAVMNPPFSLGDDLKHVLQAARCANRVASIMGTHFQHGKGSAATAFRDAVSDSAVCLDRQAIPPGAFSESGTEIATVMLSLDSHALLSAIDGRSDHDQVTSMHRPRMAA